MAWDKAPIHIKAMAGAYVAPILEAMTAMNRELHRLSQDIEDMSTDARIIGGGN